MFVSRTGLEMTRIIAKMYSLGRQGTDKNLQHVPSNSQVIITDMYINIPFYASPFSSGPFHSVPLLGNAAVTMSQDTIKASSLLCPLAEMAQGSPDIQRKFLSWRVTYRGLSQEDQWLVNAAGGSPLQGQLLA